jgi:hypothetical protein
MMKNGLQTGRAKGLLFTGSASKSPETLATSRTAAIESSRCDQSEYRKLKNIRIKAKSTVQSRIG